ncbi:MAG: hypothetical protein HOI95_30465 [Chromatiales bacterium]|jgi:hypothetical protein|nr:hypothetical protein [Chromatiales bacterium]
MGTALNQATSTWQDLRVELDAWADAGRRATLWWRDDDATNAGPQLDRLRDISRRADSPVALAVIPSKLRPSLIACVASWEQASVCQHGYAHVNNATPGVKKTELTATRGEETGTELVRGLKCLTDAFGERFHPIIVPPWNRIDPAVTAQLTTLGFRGLSTFAPRLAPASQTGLLHNNCHVDIVNWRGDRGFVGAPYALAALVGHLHQRRSGGVDGDEITGVLTHHIDHDDACWIFLAQLFEVIRCHSAASVLAIDAVFS